MPFPIKIIIKSYTLRDKRKQLTKSQKKMVHLIISYNLSNICHVSKTFEYKHLLDTLYIFHNKYNINIIFNTFAYCRNMVYYSAFTLTPYLPYSKLSRFSHTY